MSVVVQPVNVIKLRQDYRMYRLGVSVHVSGKRLNKKAPNDAG